MRYVSVDSPRQVAIRQAPLPDPKPDQIAVRAVLSGISVGTELAVYRGTIDTLRNKRWGYWTDYPIRPGYQLVGVVERCGDLVEDVTVGDRVVCHAPHGTEAIVGYQDYVALPPELPDEAAGIAMLGATTAHGIRKAAIVYGERVLVLGLGVAGFLSAAHASRAGTRDVLVADPLAWKRELAIKRGYRHVLNPQASDFEVQVSALTDGIGADLVIEASGHPAAITAALQAVRRGGRILLQGTHSQPVEMNLSDYPMHKEVTFLCTWGKGPARHVPPGDPTWSKKMNQQLSVDLIARGDLDVSGLTTHRFQFDQIAEVYDSLDRGTIDYLHPVLEY